METGIEDINIVRLIGKASGNPVFSHEVYGEKFYNFTIEVKRQSDISDRIQITYSEKYMDVCDVAHGERYEVLGQMRTYNNHRPGETKVSITVFAKSIDKVPKDSEEDINEVELCGYICKDVNFRVTPLGREICDLLLAVNRRFEKSDYIPLIVWGRNARLASKMLKGQKIHIKGRIQSRVYKKIINAKEYLKTAYEVSVIDIDPVKIEKIT